MVKAVVAAVAVAHNSTVLHIYFTKTLPNTTDCVKEDLYSSGVHGTLWCSHLVLFVERFMAREVPWVTDRQTPTITLAAHARRWLIDAVGWNEREQSRV